MVMADGDSMSKDNDKEKGRRIVEFPTQNLIAAVKSRPVLWDREHCRYKSRCATEKAWGEVYQELDVGFEDMNEIEREEFGVQIVKKWFNVRDAYVKYTKSPIKRSRPYLYAKDMTFLDRIYKIKENGNSEESHALEEQWLEEIFVDAEEEDTEPKKKRRKDNAINLEVCPDQVDNTCEFESQTTDKSDNIVGILANLLQKEEDEDNSFFKSILPTVKLLSADSKLEFRIQVMQLLKKLSGKKNLANVKTEHASCDDSDSS